MVYTDLLGPNNSWACLYEYFENSRLMRYFLKLISGKEKNRISVDEQFSLRTRYCTR